MQSPPATPRGNIRRSERAHKEMNYNEEKDDIVAGANSGAASLGPFTPPTTPKRPRRKRNRVEDDEDDGDYKYKVDEEDEEEEERPGTPSPAPKVTRMIPSPRKKQRKQVAEWNDIPIWLDKNYCPLLEKLPVEILDQIVGCSSGLLLPDYVALSGTCMMFRQMFTPLVWQRHTYQPIQTLFSSAWATMEEGVKPPFDIGNCDIRERLLEQMNNETTIVMSTARTIYKVADAKLKTLFHTRKPNCYHRNAKDMYIYREPAVRRLAYMLRGGYVEHLEWVKEVNRRAAKTKETLIANGTGRPRGALYQDNEY